MRRFFFHSNQRQDDLVTLDSEESHHISKVLRLKKGEKVELCEGKGLVYLAEIVMTGKSVQLRIVEELGKGQHEQHSRAGLFVGQGAIKIKKMELVIQKCTELGVDGFYPYVGKRSQGNVVQQYRGKGERWRRIVAEACKQSLRSSSLEVHEIISFDEMISLMDKEEGVLKLLLWEKERQTTFTSFSRQLGQNSTVILLLGPEGGFTHEEVAEARARGWQTVGLGERILRAETAAIAAVAIVQHHRGDM